MKQHTHIKEVQHTQTKQILSIERNEEMFFTRNTYIPTRACIFLFILREIDAKTKKNIKKHQEQIGKQKGKSMNNL